jgi:hypothetical protein
MTRVARIREVVVDHVTYYVPSNVTRCYGDATNAWIVRLYAHHTKVLQRVFSDNKCGGTEKALKQAAEYASANRFEPLSKINLDPSKGIARICKLERGKYEVFYLEVRPVFDKKPIRIYVGTASTVTEARWKIAERNGRKVRAQLVAQYLKDFNKRVMESRMMLDRQTKFCK